MWSLVRPAAPWGMSRCRLTDTDLAVHSLREQAAIEYPTAVRTSGHDRH